MTQVVINIYGANSRAGKIASGMQPLMTEALIFSDLALVKFFHEAYFDKHMMWLMSSNDLSQEPGFQSHQMALRFHMMARELKVLKRRLFEDEQDKHFVDFRSSLSLLTDDQKASQKHKATQFFSMAEASLYSHFRRWVSVELLPCALLSDCWDYVLMALSTVVAMSLVEVVPIFVVKHVHW